MTQKLVVLASSTRPDSYFNVICQAKLSLGIREFLLVAIADEMAPDLAGRADQLIGDLSTFVDHLRGGDYRTVSPADGDVETVPLREPTAMSALLDAVNWGSLEIGRIETTEAELKALLEREVKLGSAFDVTSCSKVSMAGAVSWLVSRGGSSIYTFHIRRLQKFDDRDLLPMLGAADFTYSDLSRSSLINDAVMRVNQHTLDRRTFLFVSVAVAVIIGTVTLALPDSVVLSIVTAFASFASIISVLVYFVRERP